MDLITLRADGAGLILAPAAGGAVVRYWLDHGAATSELLRPWAAPRPDAPLEAAAIPLVPYSNRIRAGASPFRVVTSACR